MTSGQGTIVEMFSAGNTGIILVDGGRRARFRSGDVAGKPTAGARVSARLKWRRDGCWAVDVVVLPPPPGPLADENAARELGYLTIREDVGQALVSLIRRLTPGKGGCAAEVERSCRAFLSKQGLEVPPPAVEIRPEQRKEMICHFAPVLVTSADVMDTLEWNAPARCFRINTVAPRLSALVEELMVYLRGTCFQGWKQEDAGK